MNHTEASACSPERTGRFPPPAEHAGHVQRQVVRQGPQGEPGPPVTDELAQEIPVALEYNGISHATLLATPCDLEDFAYGFSLTEGIVRQAADIYGLEISQREQGIVIELEIASACLHALKLRRRNLAGRSGCGLCGIESLDQVQQTISPLPPRRVPLHAAAISTAIEQLKLLQHLYRLTGATHGAGWADANGTLLTVREDVGRHNALDKLIGHLARRDTEMADGFAVISSRASFEMVQKAAMAGMTALAAVSAPTAYAARLADELNIFLAGFARGDTFTVYAHPETLHEARP